MNLYQQKEALKNKKESILNQIKSIRSSEQYQELKSLQECYYLSNEHDKAYKLAEEIDNKFHLSDHYMELQSLWSEYIEWLAVYSNVPKLLYNYDLRQQYQQLAHDVINDLNYNKQDLKALLKLSQKAVTA